MKGDPALLFWKQCFERFITRLPPPVRVNVTWEECIRVLYSWPRAKLVRSTFFWSHLPLVRGYSHHIALHGLLTLRCSCLGYRVFPQGGATCDSVYKQIRRDLYQYYQSTLGRYRYRYKSSPEETCNLHVNVSTLCVIAIKLTSAWWEITLASSMLPWCHQHTSFHKQQIVLRFLPYIIPVAQTDCRSRSFTMSTSLEKSLTFKEATKVTPSSPNTYEAFLPSDWSIGSGMYDIVQICNILLFSSHCWSLLLRSSYKQLSAIYSRCTSQALLISSNGLCPPVSNWLKVSYLKS